MNEHGADERNSSRRRGPRKGDLREQAILKTARAMLAAKPPKRITVDDLVSGAGISRPTFYFYFASKQAVFEALLDPVGDAIMDVAVDWLANPGGTRKELRASIGALASLWHRQGPMLRAMFREDATGALLECRERMIGRLITNGTIRIERDRESGLAPDGPSAGMLATLMVELLTQALTKAVGPSGTDPVPDDFLDALSAVVARSIYGRTPNELDTWGPARP